MHQRRVRLFTCAAVFAALGGVAGVRMAAQQPPPIGVAPVAIGPGPFVFDSAEQHQLRVVVVARGLSHPFSLAMLPSGDALVTERGKTVRIVRQATGPKPVLEPAPVSGLPAPPAIRGGGVQDVVLHPKFADNGLVYVSYNKAGDGAAAGKSAVALGRGRLEGNALTGFMEIFAGEFKDGNSGSRIAFAPDGLVYLTTGAGSGAYAQELSSVYGKVLRLKDDGSVPPDNPYLGRPGARPEVFSLGHRDQLGLAVHPATGALLAADHGPNGGDEVNVVLARRNFGWPNSSYGRNYDGSRFSDAPVATGEEQPLLLWVPSIAPTGLAVYTGDKFPAWKGNLFVGSARRGEVPRTGGLERVVLNDRLQELRRETLLTELHQRIRDVRQGPDGLLYVITDEDDGVLLRLEPAAAPASPAVAQAPGATTAFEGARVIVGDGRTPIDNATIVVTAGRITQVGPAASVKVPPGAARVSLAGKTVMPTIVDTHVHLSTTREALLTDLRQRAYFGVSAALSMGLDPAGVPFAVRAEAPAGMARSFLAGRGITMPEPGRSDVPYWVTSEAEARKAVQEQAALKVDLIKIWVDDRDGKYKKLPPELYTPVIDEAHKHQLRVAAHIFNLADAKGLLKAGIDAFAHGIRDVDADDEVVTLIKARKHVVLIPNMPDRGVKADYTWLKGSIPDGELAKLQAGATDRPAAQAAWGIQARNLKKLADAGMTIAVGTDGNTAWAPHVEMADMVASGMTPAQVIVAATKNGAEFLRMSDTGTIAVGKNADLLVLDANPLDDIANTRRISAVYLKGVAVDRATAMKAAAAQ